MNVDNTEGGPDIPYLRLTRLASTVRGANSVTYVFTICEYGGGELAFCRLTGAEEFADGFELGLKMRIDEDRHYIVREEIGEGDVADHAATLEPWIETT